MRRVLAVLAVIAVFGAACGDDDDGSDSKSSDTTAAAGGAKSITVEVDSSSDELPMSALAYFPQAVTVHAGDTVSFHSNDSGEPHTVTFGTIVDEGLNAFNALPDEIKNSEEPPDPSKLPPDQAALVQKAMAIDEKLPSLLPDGPGDANQFSANPCFLDTGEPSTDSACPKGEQPAFDGTQVVYNSGYLADDASFEMTLADDIAPGTYNYFCLLHRQGMTGTVTVVAEAEKTLGPGKVEKAGTEELETRFLSKLRPAATDLAKTPADQPVAGAPPAEGEEELEASLNAFGPEEVPVKAGSAVTWTVFGAHTIAVNAPQDAVGLMTKAPDGTWHANEKVFAPEGGPGAPPPPEQSGPPDPNAKPVLVDGGSYDGTGYHSSGAILSFGPPGYQYKLTFTKAGTYQISCQIHPDMKETVKVT